jgi:hypothetical protein
MPVNRSRSYDMHSPAETLASVGQGATIASAGDFIGIYGPGLPVYGSLVGFSSGPIAGIHLPSNIRLRD